MRLGPDAVESQGEPYWWHDARSASVEPPAALPERADAVVVGAGYTGLSAALTLAREGCSTVVLEAGTPGQGASTRNGGMCGDRLKPGYRELVDRCGSAQALALVHEAGEALSFLFAFVADEGIDCALSRVGRFAGAIKPGHYEAMAREAEALRRDAGCDIQVVPSSEVQRYVATDAYCGGWMMPSHGGLHPARFHRGLLNRVKAAGAQVLGQTPVSTINREDDATRLTTPRGTITARRVIVATNGYTGAESPDLTRRVIPITSHMIATEPMQADKVRALIPGGRMIVDSNRLLTYFRPSPDGTRILLGGRASFGEIPLAESARRLRGHLGRLFPALAEVRVDHVWTGYVAYSFDRLPHLGQRNGVTYAMAYCGSGVVLSTWLGRKAALTALGRKEGETAFAQQPFPARPYYRGQPWFIPMAAAWYRIADRIGR